MRYSTLVLFTLVINQRMVCSFVNNMYPGDEYNETSSGLTEGLDMFDNTMGDLDLNSELMDFEAFSPDIDFGDSNTDIMWDPEFTLADATVSDICAG